MTVIRGIDVSAAQGFVDWKAVRAAGIRFVYAKSASGNDPGVDDFFGLNVAAAKAAGLAIGAYFFGYPLPTRKVGDGRSPVEQARRAFDASRGLGTGKGELPPALDLEWPSPGAEQTKWGCSPGQILDWGLGYLEEIAALSGRRPVVYTYPDFWGHAGGATREDYAAHYLWLADYATAEGRVPGPAERPRHLAPWTAATLWQHDGDKGLAMPNGHDADFDVFIGEESEFQVFCNS